MRPDLLWRSGLWMLLASCPALAADPGAQPLGGLPREFWIYYAEFGDERGELLDPLEFSEASRLPRRDARAEQEHEQEQPAQPASEQGEEKRNESGQ